MKLNSYINKWLYNNYEYSELDELSSFAKFVIDKSIISYETFSFFIRCFLIIILPLLLKNITTLMGGKVFEECAILKYVGICAFASSCSSLLYYILTRIYRLCGNVRFIPIVLMFLFVLLSPSILQETGFVVLLSVIGFFLHFGMFFVSVSARKSYSVYYKRDFIDLVNDAAYQEFQRWYNKTFGEEYSDACANKDTTYTYDEEYSERTQQAQQEYQNTEKNDFDEISEMFKGHMFSETALKKRYRELIKEYHPDNGGNEEMFKKISVFYEQMKNKI